MKLKINHLDQIRTDVLDLIPEDFLLHTKLGYIQGFENTTEKVLSLPSIKKLLSELNLSKYEIALCALTVCLPNECLGLHIDKGPYKLSLNVPLTNATGTLVHFYESDVSPSLVNNGTNTFYTLEKSHCTEIDSIETSSPCVIDTTTIHEAVNNTDHTRVMLLIRLKPHVTFSRFK